MNYICFVIYENISLNVLSKAIDMIDKNDKKIFHDRSFTNMFMSSNIHLLYFARSTAISLSSIGRVLYVCLVVPTI